ncbi:MAG: pyridoxine 5'-phosphate synthase [Candidatus Muiribacterium halophilum]|uniref:Pyridoxine 5'-phosphate synthase n=1 Tax=Muiribacterium halophilum TaxID=2053465 RepID=A0A2N5ZM44_MUIH1|nr:MAG: pyridoxine 5'-phosphate synthase [Candidatus Muirbacterium halophilum]
MNLGVNIDHVATIRNARGENDPSVTAAAHICELSGADGITVHLREDRRHIKEKDLYLLKDVLRIPLNLEMALNDDVLSHALKVKPRMVTLVPERREEVTTEGGLDIIKNKEKTKEYTRILTENNILVSLFIEANLELESVIEEIKAQFVEIHTGYYSHVYYDEYKKKKELERFERFTQMCKNSGVRVNAGHGLNYQNVMEITQIEGIEELNIGHSIISRAVFSGLEAAVIEMKGLISGG